MPKKKKGILHFIGVIFQSIGIVIKFILQILNIFIDRFLKYLNIAIVWTGKKVFHVSKNHLDKKKEKKDKKDWVKVDEEKADKSEDKEVSEELQKGHHKGDPLYEQFQIVEAKEGDFSKFEEKLHTNKSMIGIILGARGTGKSAIGLKILENLHSQTERPVAALGFNPKDMPHWITCIESINQIENGSFILVDEGGILFSSRSSMSEPNKLLSELLLIARHKDLSVLFITQNSSNLEVNTIRQADYMILKPSSLLQRDFERKKIKEIYEESKEDFDKYKGKEGLTYIYSNSFRGFITNNLPSFWSEKVSKAFK